jgi:hypothetical protein
MGDIPLIDATELTEAQLDGRACVACRKRFPRPTIPVGRVATGAVLYRCPECAVVLEPADPGPAYRLTVQSDSERRL